MAQVQNSSSLLDLQTLHDLIYPRVVLVYTEWNDEIVAELLKGCKNLLKHFKAKEIASFVVPGSFEIPFACKKIWDVFSSKPKEEQPEAIIAFGAVIRGGTPHFEFVCKAVTEGIVQLNNSQPIPIIFGILTLENEQQAWERLGGIHGHKGEEAAITALKMIKFNRELSK